MNIRENSRVGRPFDSISFIWKNKISKFVSFNTYIDPSILGLSLSFEAKSILLLNIYSRTFASDSDDEFSHYIGIKTSILAECDEENKCVMRDFNEFLGSTRCTELLSICVDHQLKVSFVETLPLSSSFLYVNHGYLSRTWIDHYIASGDLFFFCRLLDNFAVCNHCLLLVVRFNIRVCHKARPQ